MTEVKYGIPAHSLSPEGSGDGWHFPFLANIGSSVEEARAVPLYVESQELMQNTGNEEHTSGKRADLPLRV